MTLFYFNILPEEIYIVRFLFAVAICAWLLVLDYQPFLEGSLKS
jgi:hypothetical protein